MSRPSTTIETLGRQVVASEFYPRRPISDVMGYEFAVPLTGGLDILHKSVSGAEELGRTEFRPLVPWRRPLTLLDIIPRTSTVANSVLYVQQTTFSDVAATVAHGATKPEGTATYAQQTAVVTTIATWIPITNRMLEDATGIEVIMDTTLVQALNVELQAQVIAGVGVPPDLQGILNTPGINTYARPAGEFVIDAVRRAMTTTILNGQVVPTAVVLHPNDLESLELSGGGGGTSGTFGGSAFGGGGPTTVTNLGLRWSMAELGVVQSTAIPQGTGLIGAFDVGCMLFDRQRGRVVRGTIDDNFSRNIQILRAELEAAFAVLRPQAFTKIVF